MVYYIGVGSNLGDRLRNIKGALRSLKETEDVALKKCSPVYETQAWGEKNQRDFLNLVVKIISRLSPRELLFKLKEIEKKTGRRPGGERWAAREIDLDILFCGNKVIRGEDLEIPHPLIQERAFVLKPLSDLAPSLKHPMLGLTVRQMLKSLKSHAGVVLRKKNIPFKV